MFLVTDSGYWWTIQYENHQHNEKIANIMILPPTSKISHHHKVTNITMSPLSLSLVVLVWTFKVHSFKKNVIFQFCKNLKKNFDSGICMFDVVKCHLSFWTDFKREYSRIFQINQWSIIINSKRILAPYVKIVVRVIYVQEMFKKYAART